MKKEPCAPQVGSDVEVFLVDTKQNVLVPCVGIVKGTKAKPFKPVDAPNGFGIQEDNVMLEYNIPPAESYHAFNENHTYAHRMIHKTLDEGYSFIAETDHQFKADQLTSDQAQLIGCEPDFNAYDGGQERMACPPLDRWRSCGGHIHLGGDFNCPDWVAALFAELHIGVISGAVSMLNSRRNRWYGKPGVYRPKPYGIEYRTPCNNWIRSEDQISQVGFGAIGLARWLTENTAGAIRQVFKQINWMRVQAYIGNDIGNDDRNNVRTAIIRESQKVGLNI